MHSKILFREKQKFTQWWLCLLLLVPLGYVMLTILSPVFEAYENTSGNLSFSLILPFEFWIVLFVSAMVTVLFLVVKMETRIDSDMITVKHFFFVQKEFRWNEIVAAEIVKYGFLGYGIRISIKYGKVYNVKGNHGLFLRLKNGGKVLVGTQKPGEIERVLKALSVLPGER